MTLRQLIRPRWRIGIVDNSLEGIVGGEELRVQWPANPFHDRWFADPFIVSVKDNEVKLLVEDYRYADDIGRISRIIVDMERNSIVSCKAVLVGRHFSFPAIMRKDGKIYVYPEQGRQGKLDIYEYDEKNDVCQYVKTLSKEPFTDAIIYNNVIFSTKLPEPNGKRLWMKPTPTPSQKGRETSNLELDVLNTPKVYTFEECIARNAGDFFECNGKVYRPAQESNQWYGNALSIQEFRDGEFTEVRRISGLHTLNSYQGVTVVDRKVFPFKWVYRLLRRTDK